MSSARRSPGRPLSEVLLAKLDDYFQEDRPRRAVCGCPNTNP
jgi:hypothetical protein